MSEAVSTCADCGRSDAAWVSYSQEHGKDLCYACNEAKGSGAEPEAEAVDEKTAAENDELRIVTAEEFGAVDEPGAESVLGPEGEAVFPNGGDVMIYGDGGASKTTLAIDCACHLAAGENWLGIPVPRPVRVLLIEAEGPRPLFRSKIRAKVESWQGSDLGGRLKVMETPWASFRFPDAEETAALIGELEIDVLIVGPLTRVGWDELGTLQEVRAFMDQVAEFREQTGCSLVIIIIHHENKGGKVSGSFEGAGDTLLHTEVRSRGKTNLTFQKVRWSSQWHKQKLELAWIEGEGFQPIEDPDRDLIAEMTAWLVERPEHYHSTTKEIATEKRIERTGGKVDKLKGIGAKEKEVRDLLEDRQDLFRLRTGQEAKAVGRRANAKVWDVKDGPGDQGADDATGGELFDA